MKIWLLHRRRLLTAALFAAAVLGVISVIRWPVLARAYQTDRQLPIYCVNREQKVCSISFDAAWGDANLRQLQRTG